MKNINIKGVSKCPNLDRRINLPNGAIVMHKKDNEVIGVYLNFAEDPV